LNVWSLVICRLNCLKLCCRIFEWINQIIMQSFFRVLFIFVLNLLFGSVIMIGQDLTLTYDTLNDRSVDLTKLKSNIPVSRYTTRFGTEVTANMKLIVGSPAKVDGVYVSFLNNRIPGNKLSAEGHKAITSEFEGNYLVIREMVTWNPKLEEEMKMAGDNRHVVAEDLQLKDAPVSSEEELDMLKQHPLIIIAYATSPNGGEMTITDLERAIETGELKDPKVPIITEEMRGQLSKIDKMLERGDITREKHKKLQSDILQNGIQK
jgi:hypothetical protein